MTLDPKLKAAQELGIKLEDRDNLSKDDPFYYLDPQTRDIYHNHSNQFAVAGSKTTSGRPINLSDPHLGGGLQSRALWFIPFRMKCPELNFFGGLTPGTAMIPFGGSNNLSWSFTANAPEYLLMYGLSALNPSYNKDDVNFSAINRIYEEGFRYKSHLTNGYVEPQKTEFTLTSKDGESKTYKFLETTHGRICYFVGVGSLGIGVSGHASGVAFALSHNLRRINPTYQFLGMMQSETLSEYNSYYGNQYQIQYNNIVTTNESPNGRMQYTCGARYRKMVTSSINCYKVLNGLAASANWVRPEYNGFPTDDLDLSFYSLSELPQEIDPPAGFLVCNNVPPSLVTENCTIQLSAYPRSMIVVNDPNDLLITRPLFRHLNCSGLLSQAVAVGNVTPQTLSAIELNTSGSYLEYVRDLSAVFVASANSVSGYTDPEVAAVLFTIFGLTPAAASGNASAAIASWHSRGYAGAPSSTYVTEVAFFDHYRNNFSNPVIVGQFGANQRRLIALASVSSAYASIAAPLGKTWGTLAASEASYIYPESFTIDNYFSLVTNPRYRNKTGYGGGCINAIDIAYLPNTSAVFFTPGGAILNTIYAHKSNASQFEMYYRSINPPTRNHAKIYNDVIPSSTAEGKFLRITFNDTPIYDKRDVNINVYLDNSLNIIDIQGLDHQFASGSSLARHEVSGVALNSYKRTYNPTGTVYLRRDLDNSIDAAFQLSGATNLSRKAFRSRGYEHIMPKSSYYDRTGFNMPITWDVSSRDESRFIPLGFIPSALKYQDIADYINLPDVYAFCENYGSDNLYYGFAVSNTYPCRGYKPIKNGIDYYVDRGQIPDIYTVMHYIKENIKIQNASALVYSNLSAYEAEMKWKDVIQSLANASPDPSGYDSSSAYLYYNFKFGREFHKWYNTYKDEFARHHTAASLVDLDGPNILAHTLGSILRNSKFNIVGSNASSVTTTLNDIKYITNNSDFLSNGGYVASATSSIYVGSREVRNATILDGIELVHTSGVTPNNFFICYNLDKDNKRKSEPDYLYDNAFIQMRSLEGLPRVRFDLKRYSNPVLENHPIETNFLLPNHEFRINLNVLAANDTGTTIGDCTLGVWIHTSSEGGNVWTFNNEGAWIQHSNNVSYETLFREYTHILRFNRKDLTDTTNRRFNCITNTTPNKQSNVLLSFTENDFQSFTLDFNTFNYQLSNYNTNKYEKTLIHKEPYYSTYGSPHRKNQDYIIEIFMMPSQNNSDKFILLSGINVVDTTLKQYSEILVNADNIGIPLDSVYCNDFRVPLSKEQLLAVARYYNTIAGYYSSEMPYASRDATKTASFLGVSGGSRVNYVINPDWASVTKDANSSLIRTLIVDL